MKFKLRYPMRAMSFHLVFHPFAWGIHYVNRSKQLTETAKAYGSELWWFRFGCFTLSYKRML